MKYRGIKDEIINSINFIDLKSFLEARQWHSQIINSNIFLFKKNENEFLISSDFRSPDQTRRIIDALKTIEDAEQLSVVQIINDIQNTAVDIIRFRVGGPIIENGTIPIDIGIDLFNGGKKALLASACFAADPQKYHSRLQRSEAEAFINNCRIGQTENSSFVTTFICPISPSTDINNSNYSRSVTTNLLQSTNALLSSINGNDIQSLATNTQPAISGNLCDAILQILPSSQGNSFLEISASWSDKLPAPTILNRVTIQAPYYDKIVQVADLLKPQILTQASTFYARVDSLQGRPDSNGNMIGEVSLVFVDESEELIKANASLNSSDYQKAWQAHGSNKHISIQGTLHKGSGRRRSLVKDITNVELTI